MTREVIETRTDRLWMEDDGIVRTLTLPEAHLTIDDAERYVQALARLTRGNRTPILVDARALKGMDRTARAYFSGPEMIAVSAAVGVVVGGIVSRVIVNFFLGLNKPPYPVKMFTSATEAKLWLSGFLNHTDVREQTPK